MDAPARIAKNKTRRRTSRKAKLPRRPTIISPAGHIRSYNPLLFTLLILTGSTLSFIGGYVNSICISSFYRTSLSAFTGTTSKMAVELAQGNVLTAFNLLLLILSFALGCFISGALVGGSSFRIDRPYGLVLLLESVALLLGFLLDKTVLHLSGSPTFSWQLGAYCMSLACGLQNGMCTTFSGAVIRTTHVTGTLTDIGLILGQAIFHVRTRKHIWKLKVLVPLYGAFYLGGVIGYLFYKVLLSKAILLPSGLVGVSGIAHLCYNKTKTNRVDWSLADERNKGNDTTTALFDKEPADLTGVSVQDGKDPASTA